MNKNPIKWNFLGLTGETPSHSYVIAADWETLEGYTIRVANMKNNLNPVTLGTAMTESEARIVA